MEQAKLVERAGMAELAVLEHVARRGAEPRAVAGDAGELGRDDPGHHRLDRLAGIAVEQAGLEGAHQMVGRVARHAEIDGAHLAAVQLGELRGQRLVVGQALAEDEGVAHEEIGVGAGRRLRRDARGIGIEMVGAAIEEVRPEGRGVQHLAVGLGPEAQDRIGRRPPARHRRLHQAVVDRRRREQAGKGVEHRQAERQRRRDQRRGAPAIAAKQHDACNSQHGRQRAGPHRRGQQHGADRQGGEQRRGKPQISTDARH